MHGMTVAQIIVATWCLSIVLVDVWSRCVPNVLTGGACLIAICWLLINGHSILNASPSSVALGVGVSLLLTLPAYFTHLLGAGDVKLLLAIALVGGLHLTLSAFVIAAMLAIIFLIAHSLLSGFSRYSEKPERWIPFGAAFSAGLLCVIGITS
jgi:prepilin peptidase CpaA